MLAGSVSASEPAAVLGSDEVAERLYADLMTYPTGRLFGQLSGSADWARGAIALRLGRVDDAEAHFRSGLAWASGLFSSSGFSPSIFTKPPSGIHAITYSVSPRTQRMR